MAAAPLFSCVMSLMRARTQAELLVPAPWAELGHWEKTIEEVANATE